MKYECIKDFDNKDRYYFIGDVIEKQELNTLTQNEALNFKTIDPLIDLFPIQFFDDYTDDYKLNN